MEKYVSFQYQPDKKYSKLFTTTSDCIGVYYYIEWILILINK